MDAASGAMYGFSANAPPAMGGSKAHSMLNANCSHDSLWSSFITFANLPGSKISRTELQSPSRSGVGGGTHTVASPELLTRWQPNRRQPVPFRSGIAAGAEAVVARPSTFRSHPPVLASFG